MEDGEPSTPPPPQRKAGESFDPTLSDLTAADVTLLANMGFNRAHAEKALKAAHGAIEPALELLLSPEFLALVGGGSPEATCSRGSGAGGGGAVTCPASFPNAVSPSRARSQADPLAVPGGEALDPVGFSDDDDGGDDDGDDDGDDGDDDGDDGDGGGAPPPNPAAASRATLGSTSGAAGHLMAPLSPRLQRVGRLLRIATEQSRRRPTLPALLGGASSAASSSAAGGAAQAAQAAAAGVEKPPLVPPADATCAATPRPELCPVCLDVITSLRGASGASSGAATFAAPSSAAAAPPPAPGPGDLEGAGLVVGGCGHTVHLGCLGDFVRHRIGHRDALRLPCPSCPAPLQTAAVYLALAHEYEVAAAARAAARAAAEATAVAASTTAGAPAATEGGGIGAAVGTGCAVAPPSSNGWSLRVWRRRRAPGGLASLGEVQQPTAEDIAAQSELAKEVKRPPRRC